MFDLSEAQITSVAVHHLDHSENGHGLEMSASPLDIRGERTRDLIHHYFLNSFKDKHEYYSFTFSNGDEELNPVRILVSQIFEDPALLFDTSKSLAQHLYQCSSHPNIKSGDLYVVRFDGIRHEDEMIDAIGLFKSETKEEFLKLLAQGQSYAMDNEIGININKLDKGCIIYNTHTDEGYIMSMIDKSNSQQEAIYWKDNFLHLTARDDAYHHTAQYMNMAQTYVAQQLTEDFEVQRADQIDLLNRSSQYFKDNDSFDKQDFEEKVLGSEEVISSFRNYKDTYEEEVWTKTSMYTSMEIAN